MIVDPSEDTLDPGSEAAAFYAQLGRAVSRWGEIEDYIFELFVFIMDADRYKCLIIFEKMGTLKPLMLTLDNLLEISVDKEWYDKWNVIYVEMKPLIDFRNALAHNPVSKRAWGATSGQSGFDYFSHLGLRKDHKKTNWTASVDDIKAHNEMLEGLRRNIRSLGIPSSARKTPSMPTPPRFPYDLSPAGVAERQATKKPERAPGKAKQ